MLIPGHKHGNAYFDTSYMTCLGIADKVHISCSHRLFHLQIQTLPDPKLVLASGAWGGFGEWSSLTQPSQEGAHSTCPCVAQVEKLPINLLLFFANAQNEWSHGMYHMEQNKICQLYFLILVSRTRFTQTFSCVCINATHNLNDCREGNQYELNITSLITFTWHPFEPRCKSEADVDIGFIFWQAGLSAQLYSPPLGSIPAALDLQCQKVASVKRITSLQIKERKEFSWRVVQSRTCNQACRVSLLIKLFMPTEEPGRGERLAS